MSDMAVRIAKLILNCNKKSIMSKEKDTGSLQGEEDHTRRRFTLLMYLVLDHLSSEEHGQTSSPYRLT